MTPKRHCTPNATLHPTGNLSHTRSAMKLTMRPTVMASWLRDTSLPLKLFGASSALYTGTIMLRMLEREKERGIRKLDAGEKELGGRLKETNVLNHTVTTTNTQLEMTRGLVPRSRKRRLNFLQHKVLQSDSPHTNSSYNSSKK